MAWLAIDEDNTECIYESKPDKDVEMGIWVANRYFVNLPKGTIAKLIGYDLKWEDEPVELK